MRRLCRLVLASVLPACAFGAGEPESYVCVADVAAGLKFDPTTKTWSGGEFVSTHKVVLKRAPPRLATQGFVWAVWQTGSDGLPEYGCKMDFDERGFLYCAGFGEFRFNKTNLRFVSTYIYGYVDDGLPGIDPLTERVRVEGQDTPVVRAGKCSPL